MEPLCNVSVQAMRGRFEMLRDDPAPASRPRSPTIKEKIAPRKISPSSKFPNNQRSSEDGVELLAEEESPDSTEQKHDKLGNSRTRSLSVGNCRLPHERFRKKEPLTSKIIRNQTFNHSKFGTKEVTYHGEKFSEEDLASFAEKRKLVESIVMNIKNAAKDDNDIIKSKQRQTLTSKLEKDLKNALEKGVRKWNISRHKEKLPKEQLPYISSPIIIDKECNTFREGHSNISSKKNNVYQDTAFETNEAKLNLEFRSNKDKSRYLRTRNQELDHNYCSMIKNKQTVFNTEGSNENRTRNRLDDFKENFLYQVVSYNDLNTKKSSNEGPIRPPRKRSPKKKSRAPLPPKSKESSQHLCSHIPNNLEIRRNDTEVYYSTPCDGPISHSPAIRDFAISNNESHRIGDLEGIAMDSSTIAGSPIHDGHPPRKPPRTFAHDIYKSMKPLEKQDYKIQMPKNKPIPKEIEALYTKPIKRVAIKEPSKDLELHSSNDGETTLHLKPSIAPKPPDIAERTKKRYSVADPISSPREELLDRGPAIKRNSSFRFSLRKMKKFSSPKRDGQVGKRWKQIARHLNLQKEEVNIEEETIRQLSKSEEILCSGRGVYDADDPIYAVPLDPKARKRGSSQELHYMCSPLFDLEADTQLYQRMNPRAPSRVQLVSNDTAGSGGRQGIMDGLKTEFRQSCRLLQKKFNK